MINVGVVGTGMMANVIAKSLSKDKFLLNSVLSRTDKRAKWFGGQYNLPDNKCYSDIVSFFSDPDLDAVYIATPTSEKERIIQFALEYNKHALIEKPLPSSDRAMELYGEARRRGLFFLDATHCIHNAIFKDLNGLIEKYVGNLSCIEAVFFWPSADERSMKFNSELEPLGALGDLGWYPARLVSEFFSAGIDVSGYSYLNASGTLVESNVVGVANGMTIKLSSSYLKSTARQNFILSGDKGELIVDDYVMPYWGSFVYGDIKKYTKIEARNGMMPSLDNSVFKLFFNESQHISMLNLFSDSICGVIEHDVCNTLFEKAIHTSILLNKINESSKKISI